MSYHARRFGPGTMGQDELEIGPGPQAAVVAAFLS